MLFSSSTELVLPKDPASSVNVLLLLFNQNHSYDSLEARYGCKKVLRGVKALQTCKKSANGLASHSENF